MTQSIRKYSTGELALFAAYDAEKNSLPNQSVANNRDDALEWLKSNGIATKRVEAYHYSDLRRCFTKKQAFRASDASLTFDDIKSHPTIKAFDDTNYAPIVFVDGKLRLDLSDISKVEDSLSIDSLAQFINSKNLPECMKSEFETSSNNPIDNLTRLMWRDGIVLRISKSIAETTPVHLIFVNSGQSDAANFNRHYIRLADNCSATLIESHINLNDNASLNFHHLNYKLNANSSLLHFAVNGENANATNICRVNGDYSDRVVLHSISLAIGGAWSRREGDLYCNGSNMDIKVSGAVLAGGEQHVDNTYIVHHKLPENISFQRFKNVIDDKAKVVFQGKVIVSIDAQKTDGQQMAQSILLSDGAEINCKPELEIYADDVECAHGATVGALDEDMLFYLRARGIPLKTAQRLLIHAFIAEISDELPEALNFAADKLITKWLSQHLDA